MFYNFRMLDSENGRNPPLKRRVVPKCQDVKQLGPEEPISIADRWFAKYSALRLGIILFVCTVYYILYIFNMFVFGCVILTIFVQGKWPVASSDSARYPFPVHQVYLYLECISALFMIARTNKRVNCWFQFDMLFFYANSKSSNHFRT